MASRSAAGFVPQTVAHYLIFVSAPVLDYEKCQASNIPRPIERPFTGSRMCPLESLKVSLEEPFEHILQSNTLSW